MATKTSSPNTTLQLTRTFAAPQEKVFRAWTDPQALMQWFAPSDEFSTPFADVDLRVGGQYRIQMKAPDGQSHTAIGTYREIVTPEKLVFSWAWEAGGGCGDSATGEPSETIVTVLFQGQGDSTLVTLTHEFFQNSQERDKHHEGWTGCLNRLAKVV